MSRSTPRKKSAKSERSRRRGIAIFAVIIVTVLLVGAYVASQPPGQTAGPGPGTIAPDFTLPVVNTAGLSDQVVTLSSLRGKVVVLEFMVSVCHVCQEMSSSVEYLYEEYNARGVVFLSVAGAFSGATANSTAEFIKQYRVSWTHVLDTDSSVFASYKINATPTYLVLDASGKVTARFQGMTVTDAFANAIDQASSS
jgi:peroxiredoxin